MKKLLLIVCTFAFCGILSAQVTKGNFLAGGSVSFQSTKYSDGDGSVGVFQFMPDAGYFFADRIAIGLRASYTNVSDDGDDYSDLLVGPFARYYFLPAPRKTNIFLEASFLFGSEKYEGFDSEGKTQFGFSAGPAFFLNPHVAVETALHWQSLKYEDDDGSYNTFGISVGFQVHLNCLRAKTGK